MSVEFDRETGQIYGDRCLRTSGGSTVVSIPPQIVDSIELCPGDVVRVQGLPDGDGFVVTASSNGPSIEGEEAGSDD